MQVRKDLSKTLETLKTVVRRAPKRQVKVESAPLPAPKPRGYSSATETGDASPRPAHLASPDPAPDGTAVGAVSATNTNAPVTGSQEETVAPFSSVLRQSRAKHADGESNVYSYQARTTVEELPDEADTSLPASLQTPAAAPTDAAGAAAAAAASNSAASQEETATKAAAAEEEAAAGLTTKPANTGMTRPAAASETTPAGDDATRSPEAAVVAAVTAAAAAEADPGRPVVSPAAESDQGDVDAKHASNTGNAGGGDSTGSVPREETRGGGTASSSPPLNGRTEAEDKGKGKGKAAPLPTVPPPPSTDTSSPGSTTHAALQLPTTGYQFELMWRSTDGSPEARLELLRAVPPSSVAKFFRRTPIEVDLLGGVLRGLGEAFLPRKPATALRWLKSLSKACRFGMTVALLGEADGRAAAREVLTRLEAAPPAKVDPQDVEVLRKQFLV